MCATRLLAARSLAGYLKPVGMGLIPARRRSKGYLKLARHGLRRLLDCLPPCCNTIRPPRRSFGLPRPLLQSRLFADWRQGGLIRPETTFWRNLPHLFQVALCVLPLNGLKGKNDGYF